MSQVTINYDLPPNQSSISNAYVFTDKCLPSMKSTYELINDFREEMNNRFDKIESCYVRQDQFKPIERIVYGAVFLISSNYEI